MDLYSFGRAGLEEKYAIRGMSGNEHVCVIGFINSATPHEKIKAFVEGVLAMSSPVPRRFSTSER
jgi:hypothetical protein